jgi:hypothetical protein
LMSPFLYREGLLASVNMGAIQSEENPASVGAQRLT